MTITAEAGFFIPGKLTLSEQLTKEISGARKVIIPGVAHMVSMEQAEVFNHTVLDFLAAQ